MGKNVITKIMVVILILGAITAAGYFYLQNQKLLGNDQAKETKRLVGAVGKLMMLPDEVPTIATVTDVGKLSGQKFFKSAQNGDKVLIYPLASKAFLYRPKINKIVEVASVLAGDQNSPVSQSANNQLTQAKTVVTGGQMTLALMNGTTSVGLTAKMEKTITDKIKDIEVAVKDTANKTDYQQTIIVDLTGKYKQRVTDLATILDAKVTTMPKGESSPNVDVVIIFGKSSVK